MNAQKVIDELWEQVRYHLSMSKEPGDRSDRDALTLMRAIDMLENTCATRQPQTPLTIDELCFLRMPYPLWVEYSYERLIPVVASGIRKLPPSCDADGDPHWSEPENVLEFTDGTHGHLYLYNIYWRCWLHKPTDKECKAARWRS